MATLIDTLSSQGKPTDYSSRKSLYESLGLNKQFGEYLGSANQNINFMNVLQKQPNPAQIQPSVPQGNQTVQANNQGQQKIKGFSDIQNQYVQQMANPPDYAAMYGEYAKETGLADVKGLITNIDNTVADIEDKIAKIEPNINKEVGNYLINEQQRSRMVGAEELPLRTQYADILRSRSRLSAEAAAKADLVNTLMGYAKESYGSRSDYLKTLMEMEKSNKSAAGMNDAWLEILRNRDKNENITEDVVQPQPLTAEELGTFIKEPLSEKGKSGKVIYTTPTGVQVKWSPIDNQWVRYSKDYDDKLKAAGL